MSLKSKTILFASLAFFVLIVSFVIFQEYRKTNTRLYHTITSLDLVNHVAHEIVIDLLLNEKNNNLFHEYLIKIPIVAQQLRKISINNERPHELIDVELSFVRLQRVVEELQVDLNLRHILLEQVYNEVKKINQNVIVLKKLFEEKINVLQKRAELMITALFVLVSLYIITMIALLSNAVIKPILVFSRQIERLGRGNLKTIPLSARTDEIGQLAKEFNQLIQKRIDAEEEVLESSVKYRELADLLPQIIFETDIEGNITYSNMKASEATGYSPEDITNHLNASQMVIEAERDKLIRGFSRIIDERIENHNEYTILRKDGTTFPAIIYASPIIRDDQVDGLRGIAVDIAETKKLEEQLSQAKNEWENVFDTINDAITIHDDNFNIIRCNKATEGLLHKPIKEILQLQCYQAYHGCKAPPGNCPSCDTLKTGKMSITEIYEPFLKKHLRVKAYPRLNDEQQIVGIVHVVNDITDQKRAEKEKEKLENQLRQAIKMQAVGTLAGGVAHEFNNLLGIIMGCIDIAKDEVSVDSLAAGALDRSLKACQRTKNLVKQILTFSRQKMVRKLSLLDLAFVVGENLDLIRPSMPSSIEINENLADDCKTILADTSEIGQVMMNLLSNAVWAMKEKGVITINLEQIELKEKDSQKLGLKNGEYLKLTVSDTGVGMSVETKERIFEPFFTTKEVGQGTGMGLSTMLGIVNSYEGTIVVNSEEGKGASFHLYFPVVEDFVGKRKEFENKIKGPESLAKINGKILLVDDEEMYAATVKGVLEGLGYRVVAKTNSNEALEMFKSSPQEFDLVITDQIMPDLSGSELARELLNVKPGIPIILCTGHSTQIDEDKAKSIGIEGYAVKPLSKKEYIDLIRKVLDVSKSRPGLPDEPSL